VAESTPQSARVLYEGLFLMNNQILAGDTEQALEAVRQFIQRAEGEIVSLRRWDDRKLAYEIAHQKRGTYVLTLFKASPRKIQSIERDCNLSDDVLRVMMLKADHYGEIEVQQEIEKAAGGGSPEGGEDTDAGDDKPAEASEAKADEQNDTKAEDHKPSDDQNAEDKRPEPAAASLE